MDGFFKVIYFLNKDIVIRIYELSTQFLIMRVPKLGPIKGVKEWQRTCDSSGVVVDPCILIFFIYLTYICLAKFDPYPPPSAAILVQSC